MTWRAASFTAAGLEAATTSASSITAGEDATPDPGLQTLLALAPASLLAAGTVVPSYWAARSGRAASTYWGAYAPLGSADYLWWSHEGSIDPGLWVPALAGLTGHEVELPPGNVDAEDVATPTALVIDAIDGWSSEQSAGELTITGPELVTVGQGWDDADPGVMAGMRSIDAAAAPIEGPVTTVLAQHLPNPGLGRPIVAVDVFIGTTANATDRWRVALWTAAGGTTTPAGETLLADLGQISAAQLVSRSWARLVLPQVVTADQDLWLSIKGELGLTDVGGRLTGDALIGDWTAQALQQTVLAAIDPDATVPWPATWPGTTVPQNAFVIGARLVVARTVHDASHHSATDPAVFGVHLEDAGLAVLSTIDLDSRLLMVAPAPPFLGMVLGGEGWAVGAARGTQPRLGVMTGGSATEPPDPNGAVLLADGGQLVGAGTTSWEDRTHEPVPWAAGVSTAWIAKCNDDTGGTNIAFAQDPDQANASPPETPMDWLPASSDPGPQGSEYEEFGSDNDPTTTFVSPYVAPETPARPRNVPGARLLYWVPGITATPL